MGAARRLRPASREHAAVLTVLTDPLVWGRVQDLVSDRGEVDWAALARRSAKWSTGERLLVRAAHDLWNGNTRVGLRELCDTLGASHLARVLEAVEVLRPDARQARLAGPAADATR